jgi:hypothetical protein
VKTAPRNLHRKPTFAAYAIASAAASVATVHQTEASFMGDYAVTPPSPGTYMDASAIGSFGTWTGSDVGDLSSASVTLDTTAAPNAVSFAATTADIGLFSYYFTTTAAASGTVSFDYSATYDTSSLGSDAFAEYYDGTTYFLIPEGTGTISFSIMAGQTFGFTTDASYLGMASLTISDFSAPAGTVPEGGSSLALLALGFAGLLARRELAARTRNQS